MAGRKEHKKLDRRQLMQEPFPTGIQCYSDLKVHCVWAANGPTPRLRTVTASEPHSTPRECAGRYPEISPGMLHPLPGPHNISGARLLENLRAPFCHFHLIRRVNSPQQCYDPRHIKQARLSLTPSRALLTVCVST